MEKRHREDQAVEQLTLTREVSVEVCQGKVFQAAILQVAHRTDAEVAAAGAAAGVEALSAFSSSPRWPSSS